jgi:2-polyprenyl-3-methyl-5-hydroxy-6-metoxy-1,4-benzoquinol methylase
MKSFRDIARQRRAALRRRFDVAHEFEALEESCVPSYIHANPAAAAVAWMRLAAAARLYRRHAPGGPVLDFGAATGEIRHVIESSGPIDYHFVEANELLASALRADIPSAVRETADAPESYGTIFALDSLEHNSDYAALLEGLANGLKPSGVLILSGPTESWSYRLGRRVAGFSGHYHKTTIFDIERAAAGLFGPPLATAVLPFPGLGLFRITVWRKR